jgi:hypothetical protein
MLEMNKKRQQEIKECLGWLEGEIGAKVEDLTPKTKIQNTPSCSSTSCWPSIREKEILTNTSRI